MLRKILAYHLKVRYSAVILKLIFSKILRGISHKLPMGSIRLFSSEFLELRSHPDPEVTATCLQLVQALLSSAAKDNAVYLAVALLTEELAKHYTVLKYHEERMEETYRLTGNQGNSGKLPPELAKVCHTVLAELIVKIPQKKSLKIFAFNAVALGAIKTNSIDQIITVLDLMHTKYHPVKDKVWKKNSFFF